MVNQIKTILIGISFQMNFKSLNNTKKAEVNLNLTTIDLLNKTAIIEINNNQFLADFWLYSVKIGVTFDKNFLQLLPGKHQILIHFKEIPEQKDFACFFR